MHFVVTIGVLVWIYVRHPLRYRPIRTVLYTETLLALLGFWFLALAPPRMLPGFVDTVDIFPTAWGSWNTAGVAKLSNQLAAMPSLHIGWSVWCGIVIFKLARHRTAKSHRHRLPGGHPVRHPGHRQPLPARRRGRPDRARRRASRSAGCCSAAGRSSRSSGRRDRPSGGTSTRRGPRLTGMSRPLVIAHRCGPLDADPPSAENSISGMLTSLELGADALEIDVRLSLNGTPVLMHDVTATAHRRLPVPGPDDVGGSRSAGPGCIGPRNRSRPSPPCSTPSPPAP